MVFVPQQETSFPSGITGFIRVPTAIDPNKVFAIGPGGRPVADPQDLLRLTGAQTPEQAFAFVQELTPQEALAIGVTSPLARLAEPVRQVPIEPTAALAAPLGEPSPELTALSQQLAAAAPTAPTAVAPTAAPTAITPERRQQLLNAISTSGSFQQNAAAIQATDEQSFIEQAISLAQRSAAILGGEVGAVRAKIAALPLAPTAPLAAMVPGEPTPTTAAQVAEARPIEQRRFVRNTETGQIAEVVPGGLRGFGTEAEFLAAGGNFDVVRDISMDIFEQLRTGVAAREAAAEQAPPPEVPEVPPAIPTDMITAPPTQVDLLSELTRIREELGLPGLQERAVDLQTRIDEILGRQTAAIQRAEERTIPLPLSLGEQREQTRLIERELAPLLRAQGLTQQQVTQANQLVNQRLGLIQAELGLEFQALAAQRAERAIDIQLVQTLSGLPEGQEVTVGGQTFTGFKVVSPNVQLVELNDGSLVSVDKTTNEITRLTNPIAEATTLTATERTQLRAKEALATSRETFSSIWDSQGFIDGTSYLRVRLNFLAFAGFDEAAEFDRIFAPFLDEETRKELGVGKVAPPPTIAEQIEAALK